MSFGGSRPLDRPALGTRSIGRMSTNACYSKNHQRHSNQSHAMTSSHVTSYEFPKPFLPSIKSGRILDFEQSSEHGNTGAYTNSLVVRNRLRTFWGSDADRTLLCWACSPSPCTPLLRPPRWLWPCDEHGRARADAASALKDAEQRHFGEMVMFSMSSIFRSALASAEEEISRHRCACWGAGGPPTVHLIEDRFSSTRGYQYSHTAQSLWRWPS